MNSIIAPTKAQDFGVGKAFACERVLECVFVGVCICGLERESEAEAEKTMLLGRSHRPFPVLSKRFAFFCSEGFQKWRWLFESALTISELSENLLFIYLLFIIYYFFQMH